MTRRTAFLFVLIVLLSRGIALADMAQNALAAAQKAQSDPATQLADQVAAANAAKALAEAQKAAAEAQKAQSDAQLAAFKAMIGEVPSSGLTGVVSTGSGTGDIEATLLAATAVRRAATTIDTTIRGIVPTGRTIAVMAVSEVPSFQNVIAYQAQRKIVKLALDRAVEGVPKPVVRAEAAVPLLGGAGLVLDSVTKLLSYFRSEYSVAGVSVDLSDIVAVTELANLLAKKSALHYKVLVPAIYNAKAVRDAGQSIIDDISDLSARRREADKLANGHDAEKDALTREAVDEKDPVRKQQLLQEVARHKRLAEDIRGAVQVFDTWFSKLSTPDDKGVIALVNVAKETAIHDQLLDGGQLLVVKVQKAGGGYYTKKNLWTFFGEMPLYHMGGAAVTYALIDATTGEVGASGVVPIYGGFVKSKQVKDELSFK